MNKYFYSIYIPTDCSKERSINNDIGDLTCREWGPTAGSSD